MDLSGNHHGTNVGVGFGPGKVGQGLEFPGDVYVDVDRSPELEPENVSVEAWVRREGLHHVNAYIVSKGAEECLRASYALLAGASSGVGFHIRGSGSVFVSTGYSSADVWDGEWHHAAGTFDGEVATLYVDGVAVATNNDYSGPIAYEYETNDRLYLGTYIDWCFAPFSGSVDEVGVYNRALLAREIEGIYAAGEFGRCKDGGLRLAVSGAPQSVIAGTPLDWLVTLVNSGSSSASFDSGRVDVTGPRTASIPVYSGGPKTVGPGPVVTDLPLSLAVPPGVPEGIYHVETIVAKDGTDLCSDPFDVEVTIE